MPNKLEITIPPDDESVDIFVFAKHIFWSWCGLMTSGLIGVGLAIWAFIGATPALIFGLVGLVAIFVACYFLWFAERNDKLSIIETKDRLETSLSDEIKQLRADLETAITRNQPQLKATIDEIAVGFLSVKGVKSVVTLKITVTNLGMPSVAINWLPVITFDGKAPLGFECFHVSNELTLGYGDSGNAIVIKGQDMIYEKTVTPIQTGAMVIGYLHFRTNYEVDEIRAPSTEVKVLFADVTGKLCEANFEKNISIPLAAPRHAVGTETRKTIIKKWKKTE